MSLCNFICPSLGGIVVKYIDFPNTSTLFGLLSALLY